MVLCTTSAQNSINQTLHFLGFPNDKPNQKLPLSLGGGANRPPLVTQTPSSIRLHDRCAAIGLWRSDRL